MALNAFVVRHPSVWLGAAPVIGLAALGALVSHGGAQVFLLAFAASLAHIGASLNALSTRAVSVLVLAALSALTSVVALSTIALSYYANRAVSTPCPVGRLITWSPSVGLGPYEWIRPIIGQWGIDWIVAAWAVVCAETIGNWLVGPAGDDLDAALEQEQIISIVSEEVPNLTAPAKRETPMSARARATAVLAVLLVGLAVPPLFASSLPEPVLSADTTPLSVACVLPFPHRNGERTSAPALQDYIDEMKQFKSTADILVWPESAVRFETEQAKREAFVSIRTAAEGKKLVGVSYEEYILPDRSKGEHGPGIRQNTFALLKPESEEPVLEYTKRMLVPIAESFSLTPSSDPPSVYSWDMPARKGWSPTGWGPNKTRPISVTASICLDFSSAASFSTLDTRPALVLAPARTWHVGVGVAMWEQARARAEELGTTVLWCDGGEGGVSGVAGRGMQDFVQVGQGSWVRKIGVPYPYDERRTVFGAGGAYVALAAVWGITGIGAVLEVVLIAVGERATALVRVIQKRRAQRAADEEPLLAEKASNARPLILRHEVQEPSA
ncbi:uncharacterized protein B0H18DRAFT_969668 [Fomitopsis serialis]|uniref:uncharacterized protein n=1 Tax=Fomitopsis serialis TaxID=139415 RepID=UPI002008DF54|nr:uncharacterized protein B0H18DRAFT_969668 [Neoantrodia serialis]KAH9937227.1 hypothetical protein B0H18DRAFT_969668 [Neoantrodia serialis]